MDRALQMFQNHVFLVLQSVYYIACIVRTVVLYLQDNNLGELAAELLAKVPNNTGLRPNWTLLTGKELQTETSLAIKKKISIYSSNWILQCKSTIQVHYKIRKINPFRDYSKKLKESQKKDCFKSV